MTDVHRERELKFEVVPGFEVPEVGDVVPDGEVERATVRLSSTYHDTVGLDLLALGVTLRRRTGDEDTGWQLKIPADGARDEISVPLTAGDAGDAENVVPGGLSDLLVGFVRAGDLRPVATLDTERRLTRVRRDGALVVEIADDRVVASTGSGVEQWRELEIELGPAGDEATLARFAARLTAGGATTSPSPSKLGRAVGADRTRAAASPAGRLVVEHLAGALRRVVAGDVALRAGDESAVRRTRVAVRRIRGVLRVFAAVLDERVALALDAELSWYQGLLGAVRDRQIARARIADALAELPAGVVLGDAAGRLEQGLLAEQAVAFAAVTRALATNRYRRMLATAAGLAAGDPLPAGTTTKDLQRHATHAVDVARTRLRRALRGEDELHRARVATARARYGAEVLAPAHAPSRRAVRALTGEQDALGEHQDAVVTAAALRRLGAGAAGGGGGFTVGLLYQRELGRAAAVARSLRVPGHPT